MKKNFTLLIMLLATTVMSCAKLELPEVDEQPSVSESVPVKVSFIVNEPQTRSMHLPVDEQLDKSDVEDLESVSIVAIIGTDDNAPLYRYALKLVQDTEDYEATLPSHVVSNSDCKLYFIANADFEKEFKGLKTLGDLRSVVLPDATATGVDKFVMVSSGYSSTVDKGVIAIEKVELSPTVARLKLQYTNKSTPIEKISISGTLTSGSLSKFFGAPNNPGSGSKEIAIEDGTLNFNHKDNTRGFGYYYVYPAQNKPVTVEIKLTGVAQPRAITINEMKVGSSYTINISYQNKLMSIYSGHLFEYEPQTNTFTLPHNEVNDEIVFEKGITIDPSNAEWLTLTPEPTQENTRLKVSIKSNTSTSERTCVVTVTNSLGQQEQLTFIQLSSTSLRFVTIPAGSFYMGSPESELNRDEDEVQHLVTLSQSYQMSKFEITNVQYCQFLNEKGVAADGKLNNVVLMKGNPDLTCNAGVWSVVATKENLPVVYVSWAGASAFADWAGGSLPTEAQWEYACRGDYAGKASEKMTKPFGIGNGVALSSSMCNFAWMYGYSASGEFIGGASNSPGTTEVGKHTNGANSYGLYDMHGNVWEWCSDFYDDKYGSSDAANSVTDPTGAKTGTERVLKGGSWYFFARTCRSAYRMRIAPTTLSSNIGFRIVR